MLIGINDHAENVRGAISRFFPLLRPAFPLNLVVGNTTSANLRVRGTQDRYSPSAGILQVSRIPIGGSQLSDKPVSRLLPSFANRLASGRSAATPRSSFPRQEYQKRARISQDGNSLLLFHEARNPFVVHIANVYSHPRSDEYPIE